DVGVVFRDALGRIRMRADGVVRATYFDDQEFVEAADGLCPGSGILKRLLTIHHTLFLGEIVFRTEGACQLHAILRARARVGHAAATARASGAGASGAGATCTSAAPAVSRAAAAPGVGSAVR